jgi:tetratricopeptide (TPR) repeat protein
MASQDDEELQRAMVLGLYDQAMRQLHEGALERAQAAGEALIEAQFSGGFEVVALAHLARGERERALGVLREGTQVAPAVWLLWQLAGNTLSDLGRHDEADAAYTAALACPRVDAGAVRYNHALSLRRAGRASAALAACEAAIEARPGFALPRVLRLAVLNDLDRHEEVLQSAAELAERIGEEAVAVERPRDPVADPVRLRADVLAEQARALLAARGERDAARALAEEALASGYFAPGAAAVLRALAGAGSARAQRYRATVTGRWPEAIDGRPAGFFRSFEVVADAPADALAAARVFVPRDARDGLQLERAQVVAPAAGEPAGVYSASGFMFFADGADDDADADAKREG